MLEIFGPADEIITWLLLRCHYILCLLVMSFYFMLCKLLDFCGLLNNVVTNSDYLNTMTHPLLVMLECKTLHQLKWPETNYISDILHMIFQLCVRIYGL